MTATTLTRHETALQFLSALLGHATTDELLELRYRLQDGQGMGRVFYRPSHMRGMTTRAISLGRRTDVYVGCAPRTRRFGGRDAVRHAYALWVDCDGDGAVAALHAFRPEPAIVIGSGSGSNCHAYWPLELPLERDDVEHANRRLAHAIGADPASADAARILRVPATWSHKHQPATPVDAIVLNPHQRFTPDEVVRELADPPDEPMPTRALPARRDTGPDPLRRIAPEVYVQRLLGVTVPRHRKVTCPFHEDKHASLHVYKTAERGWYCFGRCRRGGSIYDLAGPLYGYATSGPEFLQLQAELRRLFGLDNG